MPGVVFRDPAPPSAQAEALRGEVARALVSAPALPLALPRFGLELVTLKLLDDTFILVLREPDREGTMELAIGWEGARDGASVTLRRRPGSPRAAAALERLARRLKLSTTRERWLAASVAARSLRALPLDIPLEFFRQVIPGVERRGLVRTGFRCNQDCAFCWQARDWGDFGPEQVRAWIEDLWRLGLERLSISGGEPTLDRELVAHVRFARALGFREICLETNAVLLARPGRAAELAEAGLTAAFVSLHSAEPAASDRATRAPGTHGRTVEGIRALLAAGVSVQLGAVLSPAVVESLPALPGFIAQKFGGHPRLTGLSVSYPSRPYAPSPEDDPATLHPELMRAALVGVIEAATRTGVAVDGIAGPCGAPLCAFDADPRVVDRSRRVEPVPFKRHLPGCHACVVQDACFGVRHEDAERWGEACIRPIVAS
ncbi:MAG: radical SAM protein [Sorangiineae bacterium]|nr:radical SAM protein [Polyangiaceae bacterium]MEB2320896.1 radical SAM protein [Sorangiineae bacterium]